MNDLEDLLIFGVDLLKKRKIHYWLDCGTLLGAVRDNKLLPWDKDLDISIIKEDVTNDDMDYIVGAAQKNLYQIFLGNISILVFQTRHHKLLKKV